MRAYNWLIAALAISFTVINVVMAAFEDTSLDAHFTVLVLAALVITLLFGFLSRPARRALGTLSAAFFAGFLAVVALRVIDILR